MTTIDLIESIQSASLSTLYVFKAKIARMKSEGEMPQSLSNLFDQKILLREAQLLLMSEFNEQLGNPGIEERIIEARDNGAITKSDCLTLQHMMKMRRAR